MCVRVCVLHTTKALIDESRGECKSSDPLYALGKLAFVYLDRVRVPGLKKKKKLVSLPNLDQPGAFV